MGARLYVDFCGEDHVVEPPAELTFGRDATLVIDDNPWLHRRLGRFVHRHGAWWLENTGRNTVLTLADRNGSSAATVAPGAAAAVIHGEFSCAFTAGPHRYELEGSLEGHEWVTDVIDDPEGDRTLEWGVVELNDEQHQLLVALCAPLVRRAPGEPPTVPSRKEAAATLGWSLSKFNRKLDHLCSKLGRAGVKGLGGDDATPATQRRLRLAEHALAVGLVEPAELREPVERLG